MKRQSARQTGWAKQGVVWLRSMAGLPASLVSMPAHQSQIDWLGWDGWVSVSHDEPDES